MPNHLIASRGALLGGVFAHLKQIETKCERADYVAALKMAPNTDEPRSIGAAVVAGGAI